MKHLIILMVFMIGLFVMPSTSSGNAPPDQVSFVTGLPSIDFPVMVANQTVTNMELTFVSHPVFNQADIEKGGYFVIKDSNLELQATYKNDKNATLNDTGNTILDNYDFRTCRYEKLNESQISIQNIESRSRCTIRADSKMLV